MDTIGWYMETLRKDPASQIFVSMAEELCGRGLWEEAVEACRKGLLAHPHHLRARVLLGWALWELGHADDSEQVLNDAKEDFDKNAILYRILSMIAERNGDKFLAQKYMSVYDSLLELSEREEGEIVIVVPEKTAAPAGDDIGSTPGKWPFQEILSSLMERIESRPKRELTSDKIFSDEDRKALTRLIANGSL
jgi:hypothetical protein